MIPLMAGALLCAIGAVPTQAKEEPASQDSQPPPTIAIIIDDMGHNRVEGERLIAIEQPLTLAFLPFRRHTTSLAEKAHLRQKEIMLHAPMANTRLLELGPGGLDPDMSQGEMATTLRRALKSIPHVQGVNNHMGSLLTQQLKAMDWVMAELTHYPVYFVDSRTIASSVAGDVAAAYRIPTLTRDVFLDHEQTEEYVDRQFELLVKRAREHGSAIGIGHPHKVTVNYLEKRLPEMDEEGIAVATVSGVWAMRNGNRRMFAEGEKQPVHPALANRTDD